ncbi:MAG: HEPN domain-containing protein [Deltaproteobacteria bacterium]|nr:HEPN domain-containing protein [Deltaproteobacteria bacterium]
MRSVTKQWVERADYDLETAKFLFKGGRYLYVAFMCQQCIEKTLKAYITSKEKSPPLIHNLLRLAEESDLMRSMTDGQRLLLADLNPFYIKTRYGEYKDELSKICTAVSAKDMLAKTQEFVKWLKPKIK